MAVVSWWRRGNRAADVLASRRVRRAAVVAGVAALLGGAALVPAQAVPVPVKVNPAPAASRGTPGTGLSAVTPQKPTVHDGTKNVFKPTAVSWPKAGSGTIALSAPGAGQAQGVRTAAAGTPVWAQALNPATGVYQGPSTVGVTVLSHGQATALGVSGVVFRVDGGVSRPGSVRVGLDTSAFAQVYGGNYASRLRLVALPACALTTPQLAACRVQTPLVSSVDGAGRSVSAVVGLGAQQKASAMSLSARVGFAQDNSTGATVIGATDSTGQEGGQAGNYAATSLKAAGSWAQGGDSGSFTYSYPITLPGASTSLIPGVGLSYDSGSVDGQTTTTQAQSSWIGDGWSTADSYVELSTIPCDDSPEGTALAVTPTPLDACYAGKIVTLSLGGSSTPLVYVSSSTAGSVTTSTWKAAGDSGEIVKHVAASSSNAFGAYSTGADYWTVTERTGTKYEFGLQHLPGWSSGKAATNSVDTEPVYSANSGDPCYSASGFTASVCSMAYKWHLDYVVDLHTAAMAYYYTQATNNYGEDLGAASPTVPSSYVRDSYLDHIDYGFLDGGAYGTVADQVKFTASSRCIVSSTVPSCDPISASNAPTEYPDVPYDLMCTGSGCTAYGPSFFSTVRLTAITTYQYSTSTGALAMVDSYALTQGTPSVQDVTSPTLWLSSITRTAYDTGGGGSPTTITLPATTFAGEQLANRVDTTNYPALYRYRLNSITSETGAVTGVTYSTPTTCSVAYVQAQRASTASSNTKSCFPVSWTPQGYSAPILDWFEKYAVTQVQVSDSITHALPLESDYAYSTDAAWHYDDNEVVKPKYRTWGQFRGYTTVTTYTGQLVNDPQTKAVTQYYRGMDGDYLTPTTTRSVTLNDSQGGTHTDANQLAGHALETTSYLGSAGPVDHSTITSYWVSPSTATRARTGLPALTANKTATAETWSRQALTDGGATTWRVTETDNSYDATTSDTEFGLLKYTYTHTVPANTAYDTCAATTYADNTALNLIGLVTSAETDSVACSGFTEGTVSSAPSGLNTLGAPASVNHLTQTESATRTFYDDTSFSTTFPQAAAPTVGNATMVRKASTYTTDFAWQTTARATYDTYGRVASAYDGNGNQSVNTFAVNSAGLTTGETVTAPPTVYGTTTVNHTSSTTLDPARALTLTSTDQNGVVTTQQYDTLGRLTSVWLNSRGTTLGANDTYAYTVSNSSFSGVTANRMTESGGHIPTVTIYDALGRVRQTQAYDVPQGGRLINDVSYDTRGWAYKKNTNFWDPSNAPTLALDTLSDGGVLTQDDYTFDGLGRTVVDNSERAGVVKQTTTTVYNGDRTTVIPPTGGTTKATVTDPLGRTKETDEYSTTPTLTTPGNTFTGLWYVTPAANSTTAVTYGYDGHGRQSTTTDAAANTWTSAFNLLGQVTSKSDPVAGTTTQAFDADGNLTQTLDSRGDYVSYTYDALNRKTGEYASASTGQTAGPTGNQIAAWVYDNGNAAVTGMTYPLGHATTLISYSGGYAYTTQHTGFNVFGESLGEKYTIPSGAVGTALGKTYEIDHIYSTALGLLDDDLYAAVGGLPSEDVNHGYSSLDLPQGVGGNNGYAKTTTFDAYGNVTSATLGASTGNNAYVASTYDDHTQQLTNQLVTRSGSTTPVDNTAYAHNADGQITSQTQTRQGSSSDTETQCYTYDGLTRLTAAWSATDACNTAPTSASHAQVANTLGTSSAYWTTWSFDTLASGASLGNRTTQTQHATGTATTDTTTSYTYNGNGAAQPGTLTGTTTTGAATGSTSYTYGTSGNTITRTAAQGAQNLNYDNAGRLTKVSNTTTGTNATYVYDTNGALLLQTDPTTTTLYLPTEQFTLTAGTVTGVRYYPLPGGQTAVRTGIGTNYYFEIPDPHGTATLYLDHTAQTPTWRQYDPYGNPRGTTPTWIDNRTFLNKTTDTTTGLTNIGAREYDPTTGRFTTLDPLLETTDPQALNGYAYTDGNPINQDDPTGLRAMGDGSGSSCNWNGNCSGNAADSGSGGCNSDTPGCSGYFEKHARRTVLIGRYVLVDQSDKNLQAYIDMWTQTVTNEKDAQQALLNSGDTADAEAFMWLAACTKSQRCSAAFIKRMIGISNGIGSSVDGGASLVAADKSGNESISKSFGQVLVVGVVGVVAVGAGGSSDSAGNDSRGSTGRTTPGGANEKQAMELVQEYPEYGEQLSTVMGDPRWSAEDGWVKMSQTVNGVEIHYVYNRGAQQAGDFKFKDRTDPIAESEMIADAEGDAAS